MSRRRFPAGRARAITRRTMLKRMGYGVGAAALAPTLLKNAWAGPRLAAGDQAPVWTYPVPSLGLAETAFNKGTVVLAADPQGSGSLATVTGIDVQTGAVRWSASFPSRNIGKPVVVNDVVYVFDLGDGQGGGSFLAIDSLTGVILWQQSYWSVTPAPLYSGGLFIFPSGDGSIVAVDTNGNQAWSYYTGSAPGNAWVSEPVVSGSTVLVAMANTLYALARATGQLIWKVGLAPSFPSGQLSVGGGNVYLVLPLQAGLAGGQLVFALDVATGQGVWQWPAAPGLQNNPSSPGYYNGAVYVGDDGGHFYALDPNSGTLLWQTSVSPGITPASQIAFEDGIAYLQSGSTITNGVILALDLAKQGQDVVAFDPAGGAVFIGVESGICYYEGLNPQVVGGVNLALLTHEFFAESELMVEDYVNGQPSTTSYRTHIQLFDPNQNPRANTSVKVWASGPVTITSGGASYSIDVASTDPASTWSAWLSTDALGELSITTPASGLTTPSLYLWGNFMAVGEAIVVYPDQDSLTRLSGVQASDLQQAKSYDGSSMIPSSFSQYGDLASVIRNSLGAAGGSLGAAPRSPSQPPHGLLSRRAVFDVRNGRFGSSRGSRSTKVSAAPYIAFPKSTTNLVYQPVATSAARTYVPGAVAQWQAAFDASGGVTFTAGGAAPGEPRRRRDPSLPGSSVKGFDDFVNDVVNGARKVAHIVWTDVLQTFVDDLSNTYEFTIQTVEEAAAVVTGLLKTVINDVTKAIQWLSFLFNWPAILATKDTLKSGAQQGFANLGCWLQLPNINGNVKTFLGSDFQGALNTAKGGLGGASLQSKQQNGNDPTVVYGAGGAKSYTKSRWMLEKFKANAAQGTVGASAAAPGSSASCAPAGGSIVTVVEGLVTSIGNTIANSPQFQSIPADLKNVFTNFGSLATNPSQFVTSTFGDIIDLLLDIVGSLVQLAAAVVDDVLSALLQIVNAIIDLVLRPLQIPVISDLYSSITGGSSLSILDLACLLVAIPTTIVQQALSGGGPRPRAVSDATIGYLVADAFYAVFDPLLDLAGDSVVEQCAYLALSVLVQALNFPTDLGSNAAADYAFYAMQTIPIVVTAVGIEQSLMGNPGFADDVAPFIELGFGILMICVSVELGQTGILNDLVMTSDIFSGIPYCFKFLTLAGEDGRIALSIIDGVADLTAVGLSAANAFA